MRVGTLAEGGSGRQGTHLFTCQPLAEPLHQDEDIVQEPALMSLCQALDRHSSHPLVREPPDMTMSSSTP